MKLCVCIPVYNNPLTVAAVAEDCLNAGPWPLLVVDDGSEIPVENLLQGKIFREARLAGRLEILRHEQNQGKGMALRTAFAFATEAGFTHLLTLDGDGQHYATSLPALVDLSAANPENIVIGARRMDPQATPWISRAGRFLSNSWIYLLTRRRTRDSQCGLRVYPLRAVAGLELWTDHYDFEMEVLLKLLFAGADCSAVDIDVYYPPGRERVSHFRKICDNLRIARMNFRLVEWLLAHGLRRVVALPGKILLEKK